MQEQVPLIGETVRLIGHTAIRNRGTIGGSISHADPAANLPVALLALDAVIHVRGPGGPRTVAAEDFFVGLFTTALAPDEMVTAIDIAAIADAEGCAFEEFARRHGDFALASAAVRLRLRAGKVDGPIRIALGGVGDHAARAHRAEALLREVAPSDGAFHAAAEQAAHEIDPPTDIHGSADYRRHLVRGLVKTALARAVERAANNDR
jgi:carbon-monoxide dehydrogenase medium subunit